MSEFRAKSEGQSAKGKAATAFSSGLFALSFLNSDIRNPKFENFALSFLNSEIRNPAIRNSWLFA
jgi:hypothetical protein